MSPAIFRWVLTDIFAELAPRWRAKGYGVLMGDNLLQFFAWADDPWLCAKKSAELNEMVHDLERETHRQAGLALRRQKCRRVQIRRPDQTAEEVPPQREALQSVQELPADECMRVLGAPVHP